MLFYYLIIGIILFFILALYILFYIDDHLNHSRQTVFPHPYIFIFGNFIFFILSIYIFYKLYMLPEQNITLFVIFMCLFYLFYFFWNVNYHIRVVNYNENNEHHGLGELYIFSALFVYLCYILQSTRYGFCFTILATIPFLWIVYLTHIWL